ncbi:hypothetical protein PG985_014888 [Apiospora marii]|uniref:uncharacterized protein n=1 Tax=Apiospora marii TaxID=335849 RepID=UPI00312DB5F7
MWAGNEEEQKKTPLYSSFNTLIEEFRAQNAAPGSSSPVPDQGALVFAGPLQLSGTLPPELLLNVYQHLSLLDELVLGFTHPEIFHTTSFSLYNLDIEYQLHWQNANPGLPDDEPRLPLLHLAIQNGAPMLVIRDILQTWQNRGLDWDLQWATQGVRQRQSHLFIKPIVLAAVCGRADVIRELLARGDSAAEVANALLNAPHTPGTQRTLSDQAWADLEKLIFETPEIMDDYLALPTIGARTWRFFMACVQAGWVELLSIFVQPMLDRNDPRLDRRLGIEVGAWINQVGHVRADNRGMIDYLGFIRDELRASARNPVVIGTLNWRGLEELVTQSTPVLKALPLRMTNAIHIINRWARFDIHLDGLTLVSDEFYDACLSSDARLPLLQAIVTNNVRWYRSMPKNSEYKLQRLLFKLLCRAVAQTRPLDPVADDDTDGLPDTVRWLLRDMQAPVFFNNTHILGSLGQTMDGNPGVVRSNLEAILARLPGGGDPNAVLPGYHRRWYRRDPRPLDLLILNNVGSVELVGRGGVDVRLAAEHTVDLLNAERARRERAFDVETHGRSLVELMREESFPYWVRRRILGWCVRNGTNEVPPHGLKDI